MVIEDLSALLLGSPWFREIHFVPGFDMLLL